MKTLRLVFALCSALLLSGTLGVGTTHLVAQNPPGQPDTASGAIPVENLYAGVASYNVMKTNNGSLDLTPRPLMPSHRSRSHASLRRGRTDARSEWLSPHSFGASQRTSPK